MAPHPLWTDLTEISDGTLDALREVADGNSLAVCAGFPCTPWSTAGQRRGTEDERWIWDDIARILRHLRPGIVVLECTPGVTSGGLEHVLGTLAEIGLDAEWDCVRASDVGAPHQRARWWCVGANERFRRLLSDADGKRVRDESGRIGRADGAGARELGDLGAEHLGDSDSEGQRRSGERLGGPEAMPRGERVAHAGSSRRREVVRDEHPGEPDARGRGTGALADADQQRQTLGGEGLPERPRNADWPGFPPGPADDDAWRRILAARPELAPALTREDEKEAVRALRGVAHGLVATERRDLLRLFGNGVVPQCAEAVIGELLSRFRQ